MNLKDKVIVVTGAGGGIGREIVRLLLTKGAIVAGIDRNESGLIETAQLVDCEPNRLSRHVMDITDEVSVKMLLDKVIAIHGQVDGLINNAGIIQKFMSVDEMEMNDIKKIMDVNFYGALRLTKQFLPYLLKRPEAQLVNVSSMGGFLPVPQQTIYGASKAAVKMLTEGLQSELKDTTVKVMLVIPGGVSTGIMDTAGIDTKKLMSSKLAKSYKMLTPTKAAIKIIKGMEHNRSRIIIGTDAKLMDFLYRMSPKFASYIMRRTLNVKRYL